MFFVGPLRRAHTGRESYVYGTDTGRWNGSCRINVDSKILPKQARRSTPKSVLDLKPEIRNVFPEAKSTESRAAFVTQKHSSQFTEAVPVPQEARGRSILHFQTFPFAANTFPAKTTPSPSTGPQQVLLSRKHKSISVSKKCCNF